MPRCVTASCCLRRRTSRSTPSTEIGTDLGGQRQDVQTWLQKDKSWSAAVSARVRAISVRSLIDHLLTKIDFGGYHVTITTNLLPDLNPWSTTSSRQASDAGR